MSIVLGIIIVPILLCFIALQTKAPLESFWDPIAISFIFTASLLSISVSNGLTRIVVLFKLFVRRVLGFRPNKFRSEIITILTLARAKRSSQEKFLQLRSQIKDPFLKDISFLLDWAENDINNNQFKEILETKAKTFYERYNFEVSVFEVFTQLPWKFGIVYGLITSLGYLFNFTPEIAWPLLLIKFTLPLLYGLIISQVFLLPITKNLKDSVEEDHTFRIMAVDGIIMIHKNLAPQFIEEKMQSYLLPSERPKLHKHRTD